MAAAVAQSILTRVGEFPDTMVAEQKRLAAIAEFSASRLDDCPVSDFVDLRLHQQGEQSNTEGREALPFLLNWLQHPYSGLPCCVIFGELGMGKTTLSQHLTQKLLGSG